MGRESDFTSDALGPCAFRSDQSDRFPVVPLLAKKLPITQSEFGDSHCISAVHVNRVLQPLRAEGIIELKGTRLAVPDWKILKEAGDFDPIYLHLERKEADS